GLGCGRVAKLARALQPALRPLGIRRLGARKQVGKTERGLRAALRGRFLEPGARLGCVARRDEPVQIEDREQVLSLGITGGCEPPACTVTASLRMLRTSPPLSVATDSASICFTFDFNMTFRIPASSAALTRVRLRGLARSKASPRYESTTLGAPASATLAAAS